ncbi:MAG: hypothetical protein K2Q27_02325 [Novosphingobium sp.]|nr:hypothetical protein [Novosphingobium sp.]
MSTEQAPWQAKPERRRGHIQNADHPLLAAILQVRRRNAVDFSPGYRSGNEGEAYDQGVLDCYHAVERVMFGLAPLDWNQPPRSPVAEHPETPA